MAKVVSIDQGLVDKLALQLAAQMRGRGSLSADVADIENVDVWRKAARKAGRILGHNVRTGVSGSRVWVVDNDYEVTDADMRRAGETMSAVINRHRSPGLSDEEAAAAAARIVERTCREQNQPGTVEDPAILNRVASILGRRKGQGKP